MLTSRKLTVDAGSKANWNILRNTFKAWRNDAIAAKMESRVDHRILAGSFSYWIIRQRGKLLERVRDDRFVREAFEIWKERFDGIREELDTTSQIVEDARITKVLRSSLSIWRENLTFRSEEMDMAVVRFPREYSLTSVCRCVMRLLSCGNL
jgi:hypothetical protein